MYFGTCVIVENLCFRMDFFNVIFSLESGYCKWSLWCSLLLRIGHHVNDILPILCCSACKRPLVLSSPILLSWKLQLLVKIIISSRTLFEFLNCLNYCFSDCIRMTYWIDPFFHYQSVVECSNFLPFFLLFGYVEEYA